MQIWLRTKFHWILNSAFHIPAAGERDLVAHPVTLLGGFDLHPGTPVEFKLQIDLKGAAIAPMYTTPPDAPFTIGIYVSEDPFLSDDDMKAEYQLTASTAGDLDRGIEADTSITLHECVSGKKSWCGHENARMQN